MQRTEEVRIGFLNRCCLSKKGMACLVNPKYSYIVKNHCCALSVQSLALLQRLSVNQMSLLPKKYRTRESIFSHHALALEI